MLDKDWVRKKSLTQRRPIALWIFFGEHGCILGNWHNFEIIFGQNRPVQIGLSILHFSFSDLIACSPLKDWLQTTFYLSNEIFFLSIDVLSEFCSTCLYFSVFLAGWPKHFLTRSLESFPGILASTILSSRHWWYGLQVPSKYDIVIAYSRSPRASISWENSLWQTPQVPPNLRGLWGWV